MKPRRAHVVRTRTGAKRPFGRDEHALTPAFDRLAENLLRLSSRVDVGGIEHREPGVEADIDEARRERGIASTERFEELAVAAAKRSSAETENRNLECRSAEQARVH